MCIRGCSYCDADLWRVPPSLFYGGVSPLAHGPPPLSHSLLGRTQNLLLSRHKVAEPLRTICSDLSVIGLISTRILVLVMIIDGL